MHYFSSSNEYLLPADASDSDRLNLQHEAIIDAMDDRLWTSPLSLRDLRGQSVLDSGAGTGVWLKDLQRRLKSAGIEGTTLYGIDLSDKQFPSKIDVNEGYSLQIDNATNLPSTWSDKFLLVHQRLLIVALKSEEWLQSISEIQRVLQRRGYANFCEVQFTHYLSDEGPFGEIVRFATRVLSSRGMVPSICQDLPMMLERAGFVDITVTPIKVDICPSHGKQGQRGNLIFKDVVIKLGKTLVALSDEVSQDTYDEWVADLDREWEEKNMYFPLQCISARKP